MKGRRFLTVNDVAKTIGVSHETLLGWEGDGLFPPLRRLHGQEILGWPEDEVNDWLKRTGHKALEDQQSRLAEQNYNRVDQELFVDQLRRMLLAALERGYVDELPVVKDPSERNLGLPSNWPLVPTLTSGIIDPQRVIDIRERKRQQILRLRSFLKELTFLCEKYNVTIPKAPPLQIDANSASWKSMADWLKMIHDETEPDVEAVSR